MTTKPSSNAVFTKETFDFLRDLVQNNHRDWFMPTGLGMMTLKASYVALLSVYWLI
jgi:hypothetical protein